MSASLRFHPLELDDPFDEAYKLRLPMSSSVWHGGRSERPSNPSSSCFSCKCISIALFIFTSLVTVVLSITAVSMVTLQAWQKANASSASISHKFVPIRRMAFGSCTARDARPQPIWSTIVGAEPDLWLWLGDMSYADSPILSCHEVPLSPQCNCTRNYMRYTPPHLTTPHLHT